MHLCCLTLVYLTVCEELSVRDAGVRLMTTLTLCPGNAPKASQVCLLFEIFNTFFVVAPAQMNTREPLSATKPFLSYILKTNQSYEHLKCLIDVRIFPALQLFLHFSVGSAPSAGMEMDIIVEKTCTVKEVRKECSCTSFVKHSYYACNMYVHFLNYFKKFYF